MRKISMKESKPRIAFQANRFGAIGNSMSVCLGAVLIVALLHCQSYAQSGAGAAAPDNIRDSKTASAHGQINRALPPSTTKIPVLVVSALPSQSGAGTAVAAGGAKPITWSGRASDISLRFERQENAKPFRLSVTEENPGNSGATLTSSLWRAATVAALHRGDDLSGVTAEFTIIEDVDGPSAGGVICLALLSALDGKKLPSDFAFTGSILPDGTIGRVGGMVEKVTAAKRGGAKRVLVPADVRFEDDRNRGEIVDLKKLAESNGVQFVPVRGIDEAYRIVHGLPAQAPISLLQGFDELPEPIDRKLVDDTKKRMEEGDAIWNHLSKDERDALLQTPATTLWLQSRHQAEQAYRAGNLCYARDKASEWWFIMKAREDNRAVFSAITNKQGLLGIFGVDPAKEPERYLARLDDRIRSAFDNAPQPNTIISDLSKTLPPIAAQFCVDANEFYSAKALVAHVNDVTIAAGNSIAAAKEEDLPKDKPRHDLIFETLNGGKGVALLLAHGAKGYQESYAADAVALSTELKNVPLAKSRAFAAEQFFYTAYRSAHATCESDVIAQLATELEVSKDRARQLFAESDMKALLHAPLYERAMQLHGAFTKASEDDPRKPFLAALNAQMFAIYLADVSTLIARWTELEAALDDDGKIRYGRLGTLSHMLNEARRNAAFNIAQCKRSGIPCPGAIWWFQTAEATRDDDTVDKADALASYWRASLQAQALQMLFDANQ